ncbi:MAG: Ribosomal L11 methyltransferase [Petrotoga mobilis]|nr:MAG: Ribosomal L11 methyltransferase [Petrotoga mobilis]
MDKYYEYVYEFEPNEEEKIIDQFIKYGFNSFYIEEDVESSQTFLKIYVKTEEQIKDILDLLSMYGLKLLSKEITEESKWLEQWKKTIDVFELIDGVWINPFSDKKIEKPGIVLNVIPGSAFGTGLHSTTKLAAELLRKVGCRGKDVIDIGTGSGILSVLAKKLGANRVCALDNDILAIEKAEETAILNNVDIEIKESDLLSVVGENERFDILVSNIVAEVLIQLMKDPKFDKVLKNKGFVIFSGIIESKEKLVIEQAKEVNLVLKVRMEDGSWIALLFQKMT